jgi:hypothetical protein
MYFISTSISSYASYFMTKVNAANRNVLTELKSFTTPAISDALVDLITSATISAFFR